jgi:large subunit ribosomal protein L18
VVFRSLKHIYAQIIDDTLGKTLVAASDREITGKDSAPEGITNRKMVQAYQVGALLGSKAADKKINTVVFDRGGYRYHGRVKALAEGARAEKLQF